MRTYLLPVDAQPGKLGVEVRKVPPLQQRIITKSNSRDNIASAKGDLLDFGEKFVDGAVQYKFTNFLKRDQFLGPNLGRIENVKFEFVLL